MTGTFIHKLPHFNTFVFVMTITKEKTQILDARQSAMKIERMAWQMLEVNSGDKELVLAGIAKRGYQLAGIFKQKLESISKVKVILVEIRINKKAPFEENIYIDVEAVKIENKCIIVIDDVLNSGQTMLHALTPFIKFPVKSLSIAVLLNRSYRNFPVQAKYVGMSLSTTLQEHIEVEFSNKGDISAYLM